MKKKSQITTKTKIISSNDFFSFLDGIDSAISFSLVPFLSIFLFNINDHRVSIFVLLSIICLSFLIRPFVVPLIFKRFKEVKYDKRKTLLIYLPIAGILPLFMISSNDFIWFNLLLLIISRLVSGFIFSINNIIFLDFVEKKDSKISAIKCFIFPMIGIFFGLLFAVFLNQVLSNSELNDWGWKLGYIFLIISSLLIYFILTIKSKDIKVTVIDRNSFFEGYNLTFFSKTFFENIFALVPWMFIFLFCFNLWLPGVVLSKNMFFSEIQFVHIIFIFIGSIFLNFVFELVGREKVLQYFSFFTIVLSIIFFIFIDFSSNYSINLLLFFLAVISSISIPLLYSNFKKVNIRTNISNIYFVTNSIFFIISLLLPLTIYYFMFNAIMYKMIYFLISIVFILSLLSKKINTKQR